MCAYTVPMNLNLMFYNLLFILFCLRAKEVIIYVTVTLCVYLSVYAHICCC